MDVMARAKLALSAAKFAMTLSRGKGTKLKRACVGGGWEEVKGESKRSPVVNPTSTLARDRPTQPEDEPSPKFQLYFLDGIVFVYGMDIFWTSLVPCARVVSVYMFSDTSLASPGTTLLVWTQLK
jgi:hypothetical protein